MSRTYSWCLSVVLVASMTCHVGEVVRSPGYTGAEYLKWQDIDLFPYPKTPSRTLRFDLCPRKIGLHDLIWLIERFRVKGVNKTKTTRILFSCKRLMTMRRFWYTISQTVGSDKSVSLGLRPGLHTVTSVRRTKISRRVLCNSYSGKDDALRC